MSSYRGLYKIGEKGNRPTDVQVVDPGGNDIPLPIDIYEEREVQPDWRTLPWRDEYFASGGG